MSSLKEEIFYSLLSGKVNPFLFKNGEHLMDSMEKAGLVKSTKFDYYFSNINLTLMISDNLWLPLKTNTEFNMGTVSGLQCVFFLDDTSDKYYDIVYDIREIRVRTFSIGNSNQTETVLGCAERRYRHY